MDQRLWKALLAYLLPSFLLAIVWHLIAFAEVYQDLEVYRPDKIIPLGLFIMVVQGWIFALAYRQYLERATEKRTLLRGLRFALVAGTLAWTYTTLAVAAKHPMTSIPDFLLIETAFTAAQWLVAGPLIAFAFGPPR